MEYVFVILDGPQYNKTDSVILCLSPEFSLRCVDLIVVDLLVS